MRAESKRDVAAEGLESDADLHRWVERGVRFAATLAPTKRRRLSSVVASRAIATEGSSFWIERA
jgi:hypothetical protein